MKTTFIYKESIMNIILTTITIIALSVPGPKQVKIEEDLSVNKNLDSFLKQNKIYKKVPTKWVKMPKKSN